MLCYPALRLMPPRTTWKGGFALNIAAMKAELSTQQGWSKKKRGEKIYFPRSSSEYKHTTRVCGIGSVQHSSNFLVISRRTDRAACMYECMTWETVWLRGYEHFGWELRSIYSYMSRRNSTWGNHTHMWILISAAVDEPTCQLLYLDLWESLSHAFISNWISLIEYLRTKPGFVKWDMEKNVLGAWTMDTNIFDSPLPYILWKSESFKFCFSF